MPETIKTFYALGTLNTIRAFGEASAAAVDLAIDRIFEIHNRMSVFLEGSDIFRLNANAGAGPVRIHPETFGLLKLAVEYAAATSGAFDPTVRPLTALWAIGRGGNSIPRADAIQSALEKTGYQNLLLYENESAAGFKTHGQSVDLGGIAKGYAGDQGRRVLSDNGVQDALLNLGGNIVAMGRNPNGFPWRIGVQNPLRPRGESLLTLSVQNACVVTSAVNERFFIRDGVRYHHILDPRTGMPAQNSLLSATAVCASGTDADALSTALFVTGGLHTGDGSPDGGGIENLMKKAGAGAVLIDENLHVLQTQFPGEVCLEVAE